MFFASYVQLAFDSAARERDDAKVAKARRRSTVAPQGSGQRLMCCTVLESPKRASLPQTVELVVADASISIVECEDEDEDEGGQGQGQLLQEVEWEEVTAFEKQENGNGDRATFQFLVAHSGRYRFELAEADAHILNCW